MRIFRFAAVAFTLLFTVSIQGQEDPVHARVEKQLEVLRSFRVFEDSDAMVAAVRELVDIGPPAVPQLCEELQKTTRNHTHSALAIALRTIGDRRAIPSLIYALPRCRVQVSDYGIQVTDPELYLFLTRNSLHPRAEDSDGTASFGRPVREITGALEMLSGHSVGDAHLRMYGINGQWPKKDLPGQVERDIQMNRVIADRWLAWWESQKTNLLTAEQLSWVEANPVPTAADLPKESAKTLAVQISANDAPVTGATLDIWINGARYSAVTDRPDGTYELPLPADPIKRLSIRVGKEGFVPEMLAWGESETIPTQFTLTLRRGTTISGFVRDPAGNGVGGVTVYLLAPQPRSANIWADLLDEPAITDEQGRWQFDNVPDDLNDYAFRLADDRFVSDVGYDDMPRPTIEDLRGGTASFTVVPLRTIAGRVLDRTGNPLANAIVAAQGKEAWKDVYRDQTSDANGRFSFRASPGSLTLAVKAIGHAPLTRSLTVTDDVTDLELRLSDGRIISGTITDPVGLGVSDTIVYFRQWEGHRLIEWMGKADAKGSFAWSEAPAGKFVLHLFRSGYNLGAVTVAAETNSVTASISPMLRISGTVTDARTGDPIKQFKVVSGYVSGDPPLPYIYRNTVQDFSNGEYTWLFPEPAAQRRAPNPPFVRVEADGYSPVMSREYKYNEAHQRFDVQLTPAENVRGVVRDSDGRPVSGATVFIATSAQEARLQNALQSRYNDEYNLFTKTDEQGAFQLPPQVEKYFLVASHETHGFAEAPQEQFERSREMHLQKWARIEGQLFNPDGMPEDQRHVSLNIPGRWEARRTEAFINHNFGARTDANGAFTFETVPPGSYRVAALVPVTEVMSITTPGVAITAEPGKTYRLILGGKGHAPLVGRLTAPDVSEPIDWSKAVIRVEPAPNRAAAAAVPATQPVVPIAHMPAESDGSFRFDSIPTGVQQIVVDMRLPNLEIAGEPRARSGSLEMSVEIPGGEGDVPVDLGELKLSVKTSLDIGNTAPPFTAAALDGISPDLSLTDLRGKFVLLDFWATWCGPCLGETPFLKQTHDAFGADPRFVIVSLSMDYSPEPARTYVAENKMDWTHVFIGDWDKTNIPSNYGATGIPQIMLIDPAGHVIAKDLRQDGIKAAVTEALAK